MSYSTRTEVRDMVKDDALNAIIGDTFIEDPAEREELVSPIIDAAIADADAEIDGYLAKRYAVPLAPAPRVINKFSKDIAVYNLFSRIGIDEGTDQKTYLNRYNAAIKFLTLVAEGTVSIGTETEDPASAAAGGFKVKSNSRLFTREKMRGMCSMAMYSIRLDGDTRAMLRRIRSFSEIDKQGINAALAEGARESTLERFKQSKGPDGRRWKTSIRAAQEGGKTLIQSAQLRNSIHDKSDASGFAVGTNVKYAATHQFGEPGRTIRARKKKALRFQVGGKWVTKKQVRITIPARPFLGLSEDDMQEMKATVEEFIQKED